MEARQLEQFDHLVRRDLRRIVLDGQCRRPTLEFRSPNLSGRAVDALIPADGLVDRHFLERDRHDITYNEQTTPDTFLVHAIDVDSRFDHRFLESAGGETRLAVVGLMDFILHFLVHVPVLPLLTSFTDSDVQQLLP